MFAARFLSQREASVLFVEQPELSRITNVLNKVSRSLGFRRDE